MPVYVSRIQIYGLNLHRTRELIIDLRGARPRGRSYELQGRQSPNCTRVGNLVYGDLLKIVDSQGCPLRTIKHLPSKLE